MLSSGLSSCAAIGFIPTKDATAARAFYEGVLGLPVLTSDPFATVVEANGMQVRITNVGAFTPAKFTIFGWEAGDIEAVVKTLGAQGITFERYSFIEQDGDGIWTAPDGSRVAWFHDPDGNVLSLSQHPSS